MELPSVSSRLRFGHQSDRRAYEVALANGNRTSAVDRDGRLRTFEYDHLNRQFAERWRGDGNSTAVYTALMAYDASGAVISATDESSAYSDGYDGLGVILRGRERILPSKHKQ